MWVNYDEFEPLIFTDNWIDNILSYSPHLNFIRSNSLFNTTKKDENIFIEFNIFLKLKKNRCLIRVNRWLILELPTQNDLGKILIRLLKTVQIVDTFFYQV